MKQRHFFGLAVMAVAVIITLAGCASLGEMFKAPEFPPEFRGTWERDYQSPYANTLTITSNTIKSSSQSYHWVLQSISGDRYMVKVSNGNFTGDPLIIRLLNGKLEFSGDDAETGSQDNWNGTWKRR